MTDRIDEAFLGRVYRTTAVVAALLALAAMSCCPWRTTVNLVVGVVLGAAFLAILAHSTRGMVRPGAGEKRARRVRAALQIGKFAGAGGAMYLLVRLNYLDGVALAIGYSLPTTILLLKLVGQLLTRGPKQPQSPGPAADPGVARED